MEPENYYILDNRGTDSIADEDTNTIYVSTLFAKKYKITFESLNSKCTELGIEIIPVPTDQNEWCRDFMPVQINRDKFVRFIYKPYYLKKEPQLIFDSGPLCESLGYDIAPCDIILDGGNVVKDCKKAIVTEQVFKDNPGDKDTVCNLIKNALGIDQRFIIPYDPADVTRHADGMVRFFDENTVLVNNYAASGEYSKNFIDKFYGALAAHGLNIIQVPYYFTNDKTPDGMPSAEGSYINYLQVGNKIFLPQFGNTQTDNKAFALFERMFGKNVIPIDCLDLAKNGGGVLNCATWNILIQKTPMVEFKRQPSGSYDMEKYVLDHINFRLFPDGYEIIEQVFTKAWSLHKGSISISDYKNIVCRFLNDNRPPFFMPQSHVHRVVDEMMRFGGVEWVIHRV